LSLGGDAPKPKAKVLSIGGTAPPAKEHTRKEDTTKSDSGSKAAAVKAIEKTGNPASSPGKTSPAPSSGRSSPSGGAAKGPTREADAVEKEQAADVDEETLKEIYGKERRYSPRSSLFIPAHLWSFYSSGL
jgi:peptide chain release factor subunit 3